MIIKCWGVLDNVIRGENKFVEIGLNMGMSCIEILEMY